MTLLVVLLLIAFPFARAHAQLAPDSPRLISPHGSGGFAMYWLRADTYPGDDVAFLATWAMPGLPSGMRLRGGAGDGVGGSNAILGGIDFQAPLIRGGASSKFDLDWQTGIGFSTGDYSVVTVPVGLSGAMSWTSENVWIGPYATAGLAADVRFGEGAPEREFEVMPSLDIGLDIAFDIERQIVIRAAASLGDRQAVSLGAAFRVGRVRR